ncbi:hypothetical protein ACWDZ8_22950 [Streptomyces sp. NPDC003233]
MLSTAFTTGPVRRYPTRDGERVRLYVTADHRPGPAAWPTPEQAYAAAPSITSETGWTARTVAHTPCGDALNREYWLRKVALLDRIALTDYFAEGNSDRADVETCRHLAAVHAARHLMEMDDAAPICDPRA